MAEILIERPDIDAALQGGACQAGRSDTVCLIRCGANLGPASLSGP